MSWSYTYDTNTPANTDDPQEADDRMREIKAATQERLNVTLYFPLTGTEVSDDDAGEVRKIPFHEPISTPTAVADKAFLYAKDSDDSYIELYFLDEQSNEIQITDQGYLVLANGRLANNTFLKAINAAGDGTVDLIKADASDVTVINDGTQTETNAAPSDDKGLANKKYVDDNTGSANWDPTSQTGDNESNGTVTCPNGLIMKWGDKSVTTTATINFVTETGSAFPNNCFQVIACSGDSANWGGGTEVYSISKTQFTFDWGGTRTARMRWFAIGC
jgi:hypothetical protein